MESFCKVLLSLWANKIFFFCDACQMTVNWLVLHLFLVPQNRKRYNKHLTSLPFTVHAVNYSLTHTLTCSPEGGQPLDLSTASYQPSVQQSHLLQMPQYPSLKECQYRWYSVFLSHDDHAWAPIGLIFGYLALDGDNSVPQTKLRILFFSPWFMTHVKSVFRNLQYGPQTRLLRGL